MKKTFFIKILYLVICLQFFVISDADAKKSIQQKTEVYQNNDNDAKTKATMDGFLNKCPGAKNIACADEVQGARFYPEELNANTETPEFCNDDRYGLLEIPQDTNATNLVAFNTLLASTLSKNCNVDSPLEVERKICIKTFDDSVANTKTANSAASDNAIRSRCVCLGENLEKTFNEYTFHCKGLLNITKYETGLFHDKNKDWGRTNTIYVSSLSQFNCSTGEGYAVDLAHCKRSSTVSDLFYLLMISSDVGQQFGLKAVSEEESKKIIARVQEMTKEVNPETTDLNLYAFDTIISESNSQIDKLEWKLKAVGSFRLTLSALQMTWPNTRSYAQYCSNAGDSCKALLKRRNLMSNYILANQAQLANLGRVIGDVDKELARLQDQINMHKNSIAANEKSRQQYLDSLNKDKDDEPVVDNKPLDCKENPFLVSCLGKEKSTEKEYAGGGKQSPIPDGREGVIPSKGEVDGATPGTSGDGKNGFIDTPSAASLGGGGGDGGSPAGSGGGGGGGGGGAGGGTGGAQPEKKKKNSAQPEVLKIGNVGDYGGKGGGKGGYSAGGNKSGSGSGSTDNPFDDLFGGKKKDGNEGGIHMRDIAASNEEMDEKNGVSNIFERISKIYQRSYDKKRIGIH